MHLFYVPGPLNGSCTLSEEESKHCVRVLRLRQGDKVQLIDGQGGWHEGEIDDANAKACTVMISSSKHSHGKRPFALRMAVAPTKNIERFEWFLEKATELGIERITPVTCEHSERTILKPDRLTRVLVSSMKQSLRAYLPVLDPLTKFSDLIKEQWSGQKFIAHCRANSKPLLKDVYTPGADAMVLIGPEGDFSDAEITMALRMGFKEVSLGPSRLRTETAALAACHTVNLLSGY